jgi:hypothetical protein
MATPDGANVPTRGVFARLAGEMLSPPPVLGRRPQAVSTASRVGMMITRRFTDAASLAVGFSFRS